MSQISRFHRTQVIIPREIRGYGIDEFLHFQYDPSLNPSRFRILVEDLAGRWVNIGTLKNKVYIPNTYWPNNAKLVVVGTNNAGQQVRYLGVLKRGSLYVMTSSTPGDHSMQVFAPQYAGENTYLGPCN